MSDGDFWKHLKTFKNQDFYELPKTFWSHLKTFKTGILERSLEYISISQKLFRLSPKINFYILVQYKY